MRKNYTKLKLTQQLAIIDHLKKIKNTLAAGEIKMRSLIEDCSRIAGQDVSEAMIIGTMKAADITYKRPPHDPSKPGSPKNLLPGGGFVALTKSVTNLDDRISLVAQVLANHTEILERISRLLERVMERSGNNTDTSTVIELINNLHHRVDTLVEKLT